MRAAPYPKLNPLVWRGGLVVALVAGGAAVGLAWRAEASAAAPRAPVASAAAPSADDNVERAELPDFELDGLDEASLRRADVADQPVIFQFWASWCTSCSGVGQDVARALADTGVKARYVAVSLDEEVEPARAGARRLRAQFKSPPACVRDPGAAFARALGGISVPTVLVVDRRGRILERLHGHFGQAQREALRAKLREADSPQTIAR
ncbi:MAG TPA: TlpA disulfide reductase family protein [Polyangiaceae bacterium]|jgi:thiol-disulfide isomerase/thioredoxin